MLGSQSVQTDRSGAPPGANDADDVDVLVVGGGINGAGIARDLAGRGWRVALVEQHDLASHTSSASTKLIHGGLRYLEHHAFGLVRKALQEREVLLRSAPHIMWPLRFVLPHDAQAAAARPAWLIRLGLFLYDHLARRELLRGSRGVDLRRHAAGQVLQQQYERGFIYSDGWVDDARLVVLNALDAQARGAQVLTRATCIAARRGPSHWEVDLQGPSGPLRTLRARALVNATGPWADRFLRDRVLQAGSASLPTKTPPRHLRLVKGSHIVVPRCFEHDHAYLFQNPDGRIIFAIPYETDFTLIGTTDVDHPGDPADVHIDEAEINYLCAQASRYFRQPVTAAQVVWHYSGVRPLLDDEHGNPAAVTRDYRLEMDGGKNAEGPDTHAALLTAWGGKITTFRKLSQDAGDLLSQALGQPRVAWTAGQCLPGGDLSEWVGAARRPDQAFAAFLAELHRRLPWLPDNVARRWARAYGSRFSLVLAGATALADLGEEVAPGLYAAELRYLWREEWARSADDVLWRRSKLGLHYSAVQRQRVHDWWSQHLVSEPQAPAERP